MLTNPTVIKNISSLIIIFLCCLCFTQQSVAEKSNMNEGALDASNKICPPIEENKIIPLLANLKRDNIRANGQFTIDDQNILHANYQEENISNNLENQRPTDTFILSYDVPPGTKIGSKLQFDFRISNWGEIKYLAYGWVDPNGKYWHIKMGHSPQDKWITEDISSEMIAFRLVNGWEVLADEQVAQLRIFVKTEKDSQNGTIDWRSADNITTHIDKGDFLFENGSSYCKFSQLARWWKDANFKHVNSDVLAILDQYEENQDVPEFQKDADYMVQTGNLVLSGLPKLVWDPKEQMPRKLNEFTTDRFMWHALNPVMSMLMAYQSTGEKQYLYSAREFTSDWLDNNFYQQSNDMMYAWYDHGTALRLIVFLKLWETGLQEGFDARFMARLLDGLHQHGQLLASESFYARNQPMRYHNHAVFQDIALLLVGEFVPELVDADKWQEIALLRLQAQFDALIQLEPQAAINKENSLGYHLGMLSICDFVNNVIHVTQIPSYPFNQYCTGLHQFSEYMSYADGRPGPSYGDSYRLQNSDEFIHKAYVDATGPLLRSFKGSGYVILKDRFIKNDTPYQLVFIAPSLTKIHKHQDNLSFSFWAGGIEWFIDPGFHSYKYTEPLPVYARGSLAHNALVLPDMAYSIEPGTAEVTGNTKDEGYGFPFELSGWHKAYNGIVVHRKIYGIFGNGELFFEDKMTGNKPQEGTLIFQLGETVECDLQPDSGCVLSSPLSEERILLKLPDQADCQLFKGMNDDGQVSGWSFPSFAKAVPINTLKCDVSLNNKLDWSIKMLGN